jgi:pimeloyl-ACP methyl ester carboxylesterase
VLNEQILGNDRKCYYPHPIIVLTTKLACWFDSARDLLHMINSFRSEMPVPVVGIGHSLGGNLLCNLAYMHPRLLTTIVFLDPVIQSHASQPVGPNPAQASTFRRDLWPSREEAITAFKKQKFYQSWDPRVFERWCQFGIRENPSSVYPDEKGSVSLTTTKHQECFTFMRPSWNAVTPDGNTILDRQLVPDMDVRNPVTYPLYRPEPPLTLSRIGQLRPSALFIFGETSPMSLPDARKYKMDITGTAPGGSGGAKEGKVKEVVLKDIGHLVAMEAADQCADAAAGWLGQELKAWRKEQEAYLQWTKKSLAEKQTLSEEWKKMIGGPPVRKPKSKI